MAMTSQTISSGMICIDKTIGYEDAIIVNSGGTAINTTVNLGLLKISSGGLASNANAFFGGWINVLAGGTAYRIVENGGNVIVEDGAVVTFVPNSFSSALVSGIGWEASLHSGTTANSTTVKHSASFHVYSGGVANNTLLDSGGKMIVSSGGKANSTTVVLNGQAVVSSGGTMTDTTIEADGTVIVSSGGTANRTTLSGGKMIVSSGGKARFAIVNSGGLLQIFNGGALTSITVNSSGYCFVDTEASIDRAMVNSGGSLTVRGTVNGITIFDRFYVDGSASSTIVSSGGIMFVESKAIANDTTVRSGGTMIISSGGSLNLATVNSGGTAIIKGNFSASEFLINGAELHVDNYSSSIVAMGSQTFASNLTISDRSKLVVSSGGRVDGIVLGNSCSVVVKTNARVYDMTLKSGCVMDVSSGHVSSIIVSSGAIVTGILRNAGLTFSGGILNLNIAKDSEYSSFLVDNASYSSFKTNSYACTLTVANKQLNGTYYLIDTATGFNKTITVQNSVGYQFGTLTVGGGPTELLDGVTYDLKLSNAGNLIVVVTGGAVPDPIHSGDILVDERLDITSGMSAIDVAISSGGILNVFSGGEASNTMVWALGELNVHSDGDLTGATIYYGGTATIYEDVMARDVVVDGGVFVLESGGWAYQTSKGSMVSSNTIVKKSGRVIVHESAFLVGAVVSNGGIVEVMSDGVFTNATVTSGTVSACDGGFVSSLYLEDGGILTVESGGTAGCTVSSGGVIRLEDGCDLQGLTVSSGGVLTGVMHGIYQVVKMYGGTLDLDISNAAPSGEYLFDNDANIEFDHGGICTLTVSDMQANGTYNLMEYAYEFDTKVITAESPLTVKSASGATLGTLTVGGTAEIDGVTYALNLSNDYHLTVTVSGGTPAPTPPPTPGDKSFFTGDFNGDLFDTLAVQSGSTVTIYQNGEAWGLGLTLDTGWSVVGTGDFNGDNIDDFLRVNTEGYVVGEMSNGNGTFTPQVLNLKNAGWDILGTGNFDGVGPDDVLIANPTAASETVGLLGYWKGGTEWTLINGYSPEWTMVSTGDFNGDGKCDMLWKNEFIGEGGLTYNAYCTWIVEDPVDWRMVSVANPDEWNFLCSGDFDGNGSHDIAMINDVGVVGIWGVSDGYLSSWSILSAVTNEWTLAGVADFNADGTDDIAWSNTDTGLTGYWQINNKELTTWANIAVIS